MVQLQNDLNVRAARMASKSPVMDAVAHAVQAEAVAIATKHTDTGTLPKSIKTMVKTTRRAIKDRIVYSDHPQILSIEFGHFQRPAAKGTPPKYVPGLHLFAKVAAKWRG